jgi:N-acetylneuraminic acid mutarotase
LNVARGIWTLNALAITTDGKILISQGNTPQTELYDPGTGIWSNSGTLSSSGYNNLSVQLADGSVFSCGGKLDASNSDTSCESFDYALGTWSPVASMIMPVEGVVGTLLLSDDRVLVTGGYDRSVSDSTNAVQIYDPVTDVWNAISSLAVNRQGHRAVELPNGKVIVIGGFNSVDKILEYVEILEIPSP